MRKQLWLFGLALLLPTLALAQSGKIAGTVVDAATGEPLPGVNVSIDGTTQGAITDVEGYYNILNVRPGTYEVRASFVGYRPETRQNVRVQIDLTTTQDFQLQEETVGLDEVIVAAERPVVQRDISANIANFNAGEIQNMPVAGVSEVIDLQAGIEPGLRIRGGSLDEVAFYIDGMSSPTGRDQRPFTNISFTALDEVQVQTGGFNAEYGNLRSGLINVVTKEGPRDRYTADVMLRYSPPSEKYFDERPDDPMSAYLRTNFDTNAYIDGNSPAIDGTKAAWDKYTRRQYGDFDGWSGQVEKNQGGDPADDHLTVNDLLEIAQWRTRRSAEITNPDYDVDATIGGPVPGVSRYLGDLRFLASFRQSEDAYFVPLDRETFTARTGQFKLTSDVRPNMKLMVQGLWGEELGMNGTNNGFATLFTGEMPHYPWDERGELLAVNHGAGEVFGLGRRALMDITRTMVGGEFTHTLSPNTFYEVQLQRQYTDYFTRPGERLLFKAQGTSSEQAFNSIDSQTCLSQGLCTEVNGYLVDQSPLGFDPEPGQQYALGSYWLGGGTHSRDTSDVTIWTGKFDVTSQVNRYTLLKTGVEYIYRDYDTNHGQQDSFHVHHANPKFRYQRQPTQGAAYTQAKLEFQGMVANLGLRLDYFHASGDWYDYSPFDFRLARGINGLDQLETSPAERQLALSPRVGVSFPITLNSKLYFNYGHARQILDPRRLFVIEERFTGRLAEIGNPNHPLTKTVAYELGYEHNLFDQFLVRLTGYYKDISNQIREVRYENLDGQISYEIAEPLNYEDIRGFEITLSKNRGKWVRGFANYTYMVRKSGDFGYNRQFENPVQQRNHEENARNYPNLPVPEPYARANVEFLVPNDFGPDIAGVRPLGDWRISFLGDWRAGQQFTYTGGVGGVPGVRNNMQWKDYWNLDLRFSKNFSTAVGDAQFFADVTNVLNLRRMQRYGIWYGSERPFDRYMLSLHMPEEFYYDRTGELFDGAPDFIRGNDRPGDFRDPDVEYVPIEIWNDLGVVPDPNQRALYYEKNECAAGEAWCGGEYYQYDGNGFVRADEGYVDEVLDSKAYIDQPVVNYKMFLNPRNVFFGLRLSF